MKKAILTVGLAFLFGMVSAQKTSSEYLVKTKNAKKTADTTSLTVIDDDQSEEEEKVFDFISENFKYYSLCDWKEGMKFMVMPEKYDMVVKTFRDPTLNGKEVSSMTLRHKIMIYKGHTVSSDGRAHINFWCQDNNKNYYYEVPSGSFEDYCYNKMGVPTLAYLGDVDIACEKLIGKTMFTKSDVYRIDSDSDSDGFQEVSVPKNSEVTVTQIGVGTRSFPVKIIVEDENGNEFYQNVAISKTNSGMRDDEFIMDNAKFLFAGSFELQDALMSVSKNLSTYIGKIVHTKYSTKMLTKGAGKDRILNVPRQSTFSIENLAPKQNSSYVTLTLKDQETRRVYFKDVTFTNTDNVAGDIDGVREDYFGYLFAMGEGKARKTSQATREAIRQGRVILNMSEDEVLMAVGDPEKTIEGDNGVHRWLYPRSNGRLMIIHFNGTGSVTKVEIDRSGATKKTTTKRKK